MKKMFMIFALLSAHSVFAISLTQFTINRYGGGQLDAIIKKTSEGIRIGLKRCDFMTLPSGTSKIISDENLAKEVGMILDGKVIIASDVTPEGLFVQTGTWFKMTYTVDMSQFPFPDGRTPSAFKTTEVHSPLIIVNNQVLSVLEKLENEARKLCAKN